MKMPKMSLLARQRKYGTEKACAKAMFHVRWPGGFYCPRCGCKKSSYITTRKMHLIDEGKDCQLFLCMGTLVGHLNFKKNQH